MKSSFPSNVRKSMPWPELNRTAQRRRPKQWSAFLRMPRCTKSIEPTDEYWFKSNTPGIILPIRWKTCLHQYPMGGYPKLFFQLNHEDIDRDSHLPSPDRRTGHL